MPIIINRNNGRFGINKKHLKIKCVSCKDLLPLTMFVKQDLNILRKTENALCKACRTVCRNCGTPIIRSSGQRLLSRKEFLEKQLALNATVKSPSQKKQIEVEKNNLWKIDKQTGEEKRILGGLNQKRSVSSSSSSSSSSVGAKKDGENNHLTKAERDFAKSDDGMYCQTCAEREMIASTNVYYRFPMLKYKACPFPTDKYRAIIAEELAEHRGKGKSSSLLSTAELKSSEKKPILDDVKEYYQEEGLKNYGDGRRDEEFYK